MIHSNTFTSSLTKKTTTTTKNLHYVIMKLTRKRKMGTEVKIKMRKSTVRFCNSCVVLCMLYK